MEKQELINRLEKLEEAFKEFQPLKMKDPNYNEKRNKCIDLSASIAELLKEIELFGDTEMKKIVSDWSINNHDLWNSIVKKKVCYDLLGLFTIIFFIVIIIWLI